MIYNVLDYSGLGSGDDTQAIQKAIDTAYANNGGVVYLPSGEYVSGTIFLKSNVSLHIEIGAILKASPNLQDYHQMTMGHNKDRQPFHLIVAKNQENIGICGKGIINGNDMAFWNERENDVTDPNAHNWFKHKNQRVSPLIEIIGCKNIKIENITIQNSPGWTCHFHDCDNLSVNSISIFNSVWGPNTDGLDINGCHDVFIHNCHIITGDDAIVLKTTPDSRTCERIIISDCILQTNCVALKLGATESYHDMKDILFQNCIIKESNRGIGLYNFNGGNYSNVQFSNIICNTMNGMVQNRPIHFDLRKNKEGIGGSIKNVSITNFKCVTSGRNIISAEEGLIISDITLKNLSVEYKFIEDPIKNENNLNSGKGTFSNNNSWARKACAALVIDNARNVQIENFNTNIEKFDLDFDFAEVASNKRK